MAKTAAPAPGVTLFTVFTSTSSASASSVEWLPHVSLRCCGDLHWLIFLPECDCSSAPLTTEPAALGSCMFLTKQFHGCVIPFSPTSAALLDPGSVFQRLRCSLQSPRRTHTSSVPTSNSTLNKATRPSRRSSWRRCMLLLSLSLEYVCMLLHSLPLCPNSLHH